MEVNGQLVAGLGVRGHPTLFVDTPLKSSPTLCHKGSGLDTSLHEDLDIECVGGGRG